MCLDKLYEECAYVIYYHNTNKCYLSPSVDNCEEHHFESSSITTIYKTDPCRDGDVLEDGTCSCNTGYGGENCQFKCSSHCSNHGECAHDGTASAIEDPECLCDDGWRNTDHCSTKECSGNGYFENDHCECDAGFGGNGFKDYPEIYCAMTEDHQTPEIWHMKASGSVTTDRDLFREACKNVCTDDPECKYWWFPDYKPNSWLPSPKYCHATTHCNVWRHTTLDASSTSHYWVLHEKIGTGQPCGINCSSGISSHEHCNNAGTCDATGGESVMDPQCTCSEGRAGRHCEIDCTRDATSTAQCNGHGTCQANAGVVYEGDPICFCSEGYYGSKCESSRRLRH